MIFAAIFNHCLPFLSAGGNAQELRRHLEDGSRLILQALQAAGAPDLWAGPVTDVARSLCYDSELAAALGEVFDIIGPEGHFETRAGRGRELLRDYVPGAYWPSELLSQVLQSDGVKQRAEVHNTAVLLSDRELKEAREFIPIFELLGNRPAQSPGGCTLVRVSRWQPSCTPREKGGFQIAAAKTPGMSVVDQSQALEDLAVLTGGRPFLQATAETFAKDPGLRIWGRRVKVWVDGNFLSVIGGKGAPDARRRQIERLRRTLEATLEVKQRPPIEKRIGRMLGQLGLSIGRRGDRTRAGDSAGNWPIAPLAPCAAYCARGWHPAPATCCWHAAPRCWRTLNFTPAPNGARRSTPCRQDWKRPYAPSPPMPDTTPARFLPNWSTPARATCSTPGKGRSDRSTWPGSGIWSRCSRRLCKLQSALPAWP